mmetsp:Transcript_22294/g.36654  ORF Transcript_22294/g.36654 Transcript_22294/m.36654 type:complete len:215 (-) Transcript_22294:960-1604(-)
MPNKMATSSPPSSLLPALQSEHQQLCLVKPEGKKSKFWAHFSVYDKEAHPDKIKYARCDLCGRDISVKQGTGGLKNHMKFKHPSENEQLFTYSEMVENSDNVDGSSINAGGTASAPTTTVPAGGSPPKKRARVHLLQEVTSRMDSERRTKQKHDLEMWSTVRKEIKELKKELENEVDEEDKKELERDIKNLKKMKSGFDQQLGFISSESAEAMV